MNKTIHDAANSPSSSENNLLNSLIALKNRDFKNSPGANLVLSYKGGLLGGGSNNDESSSANFTKQELEDKIKQVEGWMEDAQVAYNAATSESAKKRANETYLQASDLYSHLKRQLDERENKRARSK